MKVIKQIVEDIEDELEGAEHYAKLATQYRDTDKQLADNYARMAQTELGHVNDLHDQVKRIVKEQNENGIETPESMQSVWTWEHNKMIDTSVRIKTLIDVYKS